MVLYLNKKRTLKLKIPIYRDDLLRVLTYIAAALCGVALILGCIAIPAFAKIKHIRLEAGANLAISELSDDPNAYFKGYDPEFSRKPGVYYFTLVADGKEREVRLKVVDTKAPEITVKNVNCAIGGRMPVPEDFIATVSEAVGFSGEFVTPFGKIDKMGKYKAEIRFVDTSGNKTKIFEVEMNLISDNEAPRIDLTVKRVAVSVGESVDYLQYIRVSDNCLGEIDVKVDDGEVDLSESGVYTVRVTATDHIGNKTFENLEIWVTDEKPE